MRMLLDQRLIEDGRWAAMPRGWYLVVSDTRDEHDDHVLGPLQGQPVLHNEELRDAHDGEPIGYIGSDSRWHIHTMDTTGVHTEVVSTAVSFVRQM